MYGATFFVNLKVKTCIRRKWELICLLYSHVIGCITLIGAEPKSLVHPYYSRDAYLKAYELAIGLINGPNNWKRSKKVPMCTSKKLKLSSRAKKARRREPDEPQSDFK